MIQKVQLFLQFNNWMLTTLKPMMQPYCIVVWYLSLHLYMILYTVLTQHLYMMCGHVHTYVRMYIANK